MNSMQVKSKLTNLSKEKNIDFNILLKFYVFDRFIARLSNSNYKDNFIIKGGFLISKLFGLEERSTMDIDASVKNTQFTKDKLTKIVKEIINLNLNDNITFEFIDIKEIIEEDIYGGYRINLLFKFENMKEKLTLDLATGDPITPKEITLKYKSIIHNENINIWTYNIETILAEKLKTIFKRLQLSSRMKDYYDIYLIYKRYWNNVNVENLRSAIENTFKKNNFNCDFYESLEKIKSSDIIKQRWNAYSKKYQYTRNIDFNEILIILEKIINMIESVNV